MIARKNSHTLRSSHAVYISQPEAIAALIDEAAKEVRERSYKSAEDYPSIAGRKGIDWRDQ